MKQYFRVGLISRPHGVHGDLKLVPLTDDPERFYALTEAFLEFKGEYLPVKLSNIRVQPDAVFLHMAGCEDRDEAEKKRNLYVCVDREHAVKLPEGRYFVVDLIGCAVSDTEGQSYGKLTDVYETGANDVYVIKDEAGKSLQVPALKKLLVKVDVENKSILFDAEVLREVGLFAD